MRMMDSLQVAAQISRAEHRHERLKHVKGEVYSNNHIKPIVECLRSVDEKILGFLHDVPEKAVSDENKRRKATGLPQLSARQEELVIERRLEEIVERFRKSGDHHVFRQSAFIEDLNVLTKRTSEKGVDGYRRYGKRIVDYAKSTGRTAVIMVKKTDLLNNRDEDRNPNAGAQSEKDRERLARYDELLASLNKEFPGITPRPFRKDKANRKEYRRPILTSSGREYIAQRQGGQGRRVARMDFD